MKVTASLYAMFLNPMFLVGWLVIGTHLVNGGESVELSLQMVPLWIKFITFPAIIFYIPVFEWIRDDVLGGC
jgi:hypothetical protein